jgi:hypothetical protein
LLGQQVKIALDNRSGIVGKALFVRLRCGGQSRSLRIRLGFASFLPELHTICIVDFGQPTECIIGGRCGMSTENGKVWRLGGTSRPGCSIISRAGAFAGPGRRRSSAGTRGGASQAGILGGDGVVRRDVQRKLPFDEDSSRRADAAVLDCPGRGASASTGYSVYRKKPAESLGGLCRIRFLSKAEC